MSTNLVIVESPAKAKTIQKFLGVGYQVKACMGHIRDLPKTRLGIDIDNNFLPSYQIIPGKEAMVKDLASSIRHANKIFLATDRDREGEAIAWHLAQALKINPAKIARVVFNEITRNAIRSSFQASSQIEMNKVYAQQARRLLDRIVGYLLSPLLWKKFTRGLSAGRVQSVAVKLIVDKEREIQAFETEEYWKITAHLAPHAELRNIFTAELKKEHGKKCKISDQDHAEKILKRLDGHPFVVDKIISKQKQEKPAPPFATSQLQQQASIQLGFRTKHTMAVAQQLYEGLDLGKEGPVGLITYMRTDSFRVAQEAIDECRDFIGRHFSPEYLPAKAHVYTNKKSQGAHEAIRPTSVWRDPEQLRRFLSKDQYRLYKLIWTRFVASQMAAARVCTTTLEIRAGDFLFESKGKQVLFAGYQRLIPAKSGDGEKILPKVAEGEKLHLHDLQPSQHFTQPPPRYSEATLVKALETKGIGRPSTYAPIISTIQDRGYVTIIDKKFEATELGIKVTAQLENYFPKIMDPGFTSEMENNLDKVEENQLDWASVVQEFYAFFIKDLEVAYRDMESLRQNPEVSSHQCRQCGAAMIFKYNKRGKFLGCSKYPECKFTMSLDEKGQPVFPKETEYKCEKCGKLMLLRRGRTGNFLGCSGYPECKNTIALGVDGKPIRPEATDEKCDICQAPLVKRQGRHGPFLSCSNYPDCQFTRSLTLSLLDELNRLVTARCEKCNKPMAVRTGRKGPFIACTGYPQCKQVKRFSLEFLQLPEHFILPNCPDCGKTLVVKSAGRGLFWGCSGYPHCKTTRPCSIDEIYQAIFTPASRK